MRRLSIDERIRREVARLAEAPEILGDDGKVIPPPLYGLTALVAISFGDIRTVREMENALRLKIEAKNSPFAGMLAGQGYEHSSQAAANSIGRSAEPVPFLEAMVQDFSVIERVSGQPPSQQLIDSVYTQIIINLPLITDLTASLRTLGKKYRPSASTSQDVYGAIATASDPASVISRIAAFSSLFKVPPLWNGTEITPEEYVRRHEETTPITDWNRPGAWHPNLRKIAMHKPEAFASLVAQFFQQLDAGMDDDMVARAAAMVNLVYRYRVPLAYSAVLPPPVGQALVHKLLRSTFNPREDEGIAALLAGVTSGLISRDVVASALERDIHKYVPISASRFPRFQEYGPLYYEWANWTRIAHELSAGLGLELSPIADRILKAGIKAGVL